MSKAGKSKFDVLKNYFEPQKKVKPNSIPQNQLRVQDRELEAFTRPNQLIEEEGEDAPVVVDAEEGFKIGFSLQQNTNKAGPSKAFGNNKNVFKPSGKWTSVDQGTKSQQQQEPSVINAKRPLPSDSESSASSDEDEGRKRHDTESEGDDSEEDENEKVKKEIKNALGDSTQNRDKNAVVQDDDEDLDVVRKTDVEAPRKVGGLKTVAELKKETEQDKDKQKMMNALAEQFKDASTVYRTKEGKRMNIFKDIDTKRKELAEKNEAAIKKFSGGLVQQKKKDEMKEQMKTASQDFAQTGVSKEYDTTLMDKKRFGDIMAPEIEKDQKKEAEVKKVRPMILCKFPGIPNRYEIPPGRMWDGVDRGSDYERRLAAKINERKDREDQARTWAMQEM